MKIVDCLLDFSVFLLVFPGKRPEKRTEKSPKKIHRENQTPKSTTNLREGVSLSFSNRLSSFQFTLLLVLFIFSLFLLVVFSLGFSSSCCSDGSLVLSSTQQLDCHDLQVRCSFRESLNGGFANGGLRYLSTIVHDCLRLSSFCEESSPFKKTKTVTKVHNCTGNG